MDLTNIIKMGGYNYVVAFLDIFYIYSDTFFFVLFPSVVVLLMTCQTHGISQVYTALLTNSALWEVWTAGTTLPK